MNTLTELLLFLNRLESAKISYTLEHNRQDTIMVLIAVPGQRWEIEFCEDGSIEVEIFNSVGVTGDKSAIDDLFKKYSD